MKTKILYSVIWGIFLFPFVINAQTKKEKWDYPIKPGTTEWLAFTTGQQKLDACQIPQEILDGLSTKELAEICQNYPLFINYMAFDDQKNGIRVVIKNFNGLTELEKREDGAMALMEIYANYLILTEHQPKGSKEYHTPYRMHFLEMLLADDVFISQLSPEELSELGKIVLKKYVEKLENPHVYSLHNIRRTLLLGSIILDKSDKITKSADQQNFIAKFLMNFNHADPNLLTEISKIISEKL